MGGDIPIQDNITAEVYHLPSHLQSSTTVAVALKLENVKKVFDSRSASAKKMVVAAVLS